DRLQSIAGNVPAPEQMPKGCKFAPRCPFVMEKCWDKEPQLSAINNNHTTRCWLNQKEEA
ncbi:MAG: oligopeptide/dipeptide ABC transporter ATP-binding protein, partial [Heyndrickxia sp.]